MVSTNGTRVADESVREHRERRHREHRLEQHRQRANHDSLINEFQPDAVEIEGRAVPRGPRLTMYAVWGLIAATVTWAIWAKVDRIVSAQGELVITENPIVIDTKLPMPIASINAKFGDRVAAGFVIATLDPTFSDADLKQLEARKASLLAVIARLQAEREGREFSIQGHELDRDWLLQLQLFQDRQNEYQAEMRKFDTQTETLNVQLENNRKSIEFSLDNYETFQETLRTMRNLKSKGSMSDLQVMQWDLETKKARKEVTDGTSRSEELKKSLQAVVAEREAYQAKRKTEVITELVTATSEFQGVEQELNKAIRQNQFVELKVPEDLPYKEFVVLEVAEKSVGSVMQPGEPLFKLIPIDAPLEVEIEIEGKDIGRVQTASAEQIASQDLPGGSEVRIKLSSFPYQEHGALRGAIRTISEGTFDKQTPGGMASGLTLYKARVQVFRPYGLENLPNDFRLMPGMQATAEIKVGRRRVINYFLDPLLRTKEALREP